MFPIQIPPGTTVDTLFTEVAVDLHKRFVTEAAKEEHVAVARIEGGPSYTMRVRGRDLHVEEGEAKGAPLWIVTTLETVERFLEDWTGEKKYFPRVAPPFPLVMMTDPRLMKRLTMVSGRVELALADFEGHRISITVGCGDVAKKRIDAEDPDVVIEAKMTTFDKLLAGKLAPEEALADGDVTQRGKKLVAMQLALALAAFYPAQKK